MNIPDTFIVGAITGAAAFGGSLLSSIATRKSSKITLAGINREIRLRSATKIADFRQAWINDLRDAMASFQSLGVTPDLDQAHWREFYRFGTKIELLMNRNDPRYDDLLKAMYAFLSAKSNDEKHLCNKPFVLVCQDILKREWEVLKADFDNASAGRPTDAKL